MKTLKYYLLVPLFVVLPLLLTQTSWSAEGECVQSDEVNKLIDSDAITWIDNQTMPHLNNGVIAVDMDSVSVFSNNGFSVISTGLECDCTKPSGSECEPGYYPPNYFCIMNSCTKCTSTISDAASLLIISDDPLIGIKENIEVGNSTFIFTALKNEDKFECDSPEHTDDFSSDLNELVLTNLVRASSSDLVTPVQVQYYKEGNYYGSGLINITMEQAEQLNIITEGLSFSTAKDPTCDCTQGSGTCKAYSDWGLWRCKKKGGCTKCKLSANDGQVEY